MFNLDCLPAFVMGLRASAVWFVTVLAAMGCLPAQTNQPAAGFRSLAPQPTAKVESVWLMVQVMVNGKFVMRPLLIDGARLDLSGSVARLVLAPPKIDFTGINYAGIQGTPVDASETTTLTKPGKMAASQHKPITGSLCVILNGLELSEGVDYAHDGAGRVTLTAEAYAGSLIKLRYRH